MKLTGNEIFVLIKALYVSTQTVPWIYKINVFFKNKSILEIKKGNSYQNKSMW